MRLDFFRRIVSAMLAMALLTPTAFAQAPGQANQSNILIGLSGPFSGGSSPMGESMRNGIRRAVQDINAIGGIHGRSIELIERDDQANNELSAKIATE